MLIMFFVFGYWDGLLHWVYHIDCIAVDSGKQHAVHRTCLLILHGIQDIDENGTN